MELAIVAPFLAILLMGMFEVGRAALVTQALDNAARKGCNYGIKPNREYSDIVSDVNQVLTNNNLSGLSPTITVQIATYQGLSATYQPSWGAFTTVSSDSAYSPSQFDLISVQVSLPASSVLWFTPFYFKNMNLQSSLVVMMREG